MKRARRKQVDGKQVVVGPHHVDRKPTRGDADLVALIIAQLEKSGPLRDWRPHEADRSIPLADDVRREVQRSIDRVRRRRDFKRSNLITGTDEQGDYITHTDEHGKEHRVRVPNVTEADYRRAARAARKIGDTERADQWQAVRQCPPPRADAANISALWKVSI